MQRALHLGPPTNATGRTPFEPPTTYPPLPKVGPHIICTVCSQCTGVHAHTRRILLHGLSEYSLLVCT
jgi:hypothetical protein